MKCLICNSEENVKIIKNYALCSKCCLNIRLSNQHFKEQSKNNIAQHVSGLGMTILSLIVGLLFYIFG